MSLTRKIAYNTIVQIVAKVINLAVTFVTISILTRYLGVSGYGQFTTSFALVGFFAVLADLGFFTTLVREISTNHYPDEKLVNNTLTFRTLMAFVIFVVACLIAQYIPSYDPIVKKGIILAALSMFILAINHTLTGLFQAKFRMDKAVIGDIVGRVVILILIIIFTHQGVSLLGILGVYVVANFCNLITSFLLARSYVKIRPAFDWPIWKYVFSNALSLGIIMVLSTIYFRNDMLILSFLKGNEDVGIYGASYKLFDILITLPSMFLGAIFPALAQNIAQQDSTVGRKLQKSLDFLVSLAVPITIGGFFFAKDIMRLIAGEEFVTSSTVSILGSPATAVVVFQILIMAIFFSFITGLLHSAIIASNEQKRLIIPNIVFVILNIGLNLLFIPHYSYVAAASTTFLTELLILLNSAYIFNSILHFRINFISPFAKSILASIFMVLIALLFSQIPFLAMLPFLVMAYFIALYFLKGIDIDVVSELMRKKNEG